MKENKTAFVAALSLLVTSLGIAPISCGQKTDAASNSNSSATTSGSGGGCTSAVVESVTTGPGSFGAQDLYDARRLAVSFTLASSSIVTGVDLNLTSDTGTSGTVLVHIESDSSGQPSGTALGSNPAAQVSASTLPFYLSTHALNASFVFGTPVSLNPGTYWIVLETSGGMTAGGNHVYPGLVGTFSTDASYSNSGGPWGSFSEYTMLFDVNACE